jgi:hypothetical protein
MPTRSRINPITVAAAHKACMETDCPLTDIARRYGLTHTGMLGLFKKHNLPPLPKSRFMIERKNV